MRRQMMYVTLPVCLAIVVAGTWLAKAGNLNPPAGPVTPTMLTLDDLASAIQSIPGGDVRTDVLTLPGSASALHVIGQAGSYYLSANITGVSGKSGVEIAADTVTLDLNGFAIVGVPGTLHGISVSGFRKNLSIINGSIIAWDQFGLSAGSASSSVFERLRATGNGVGGLNIGSGCSVTSCTAEANNGFYGINVDSNCTVFQCTAILNTQVGIRVNLSTIVSQCTAANNGTYGIRGDTACRIIDCVAKDNTADGVWVTDQSFVSGNILRDNGLNGDGAGILATLSRNRIEGNHVMGNDRGIDIDGTSNFIVKNTATGNSVNYAIDPGNHYGQIITNPGNGFTNSNPWANFDFP